MKVTLSAIVLSFVAGNAIAWGEEGHQAVGYIAMEFLAPNALSFVQSSLGGESLGPAATWADSVKYHKGYTWSKPYHYVDAHDDPLNGDCSVDVARDCSKGNTLLNAISNYTSRVRDNRLNANQRQEALKFLDHFIGDIGQPLHVEAYKVGGNSIKTICAGTHTELHATWDTGMIHTMLKAQYGSITAVEAWASDLATAIQSGTYASNVADWISCSSTTEHVSGASSLQWESSEIVMATTTTALLKCPLVWAQESNAYGCSDVFSYNTGDDLCKGPYFDSSMPIINEQVAKQGYRLAAWLNDIFDGTPMVQ